MEGNQEDHRCKKRQLVSYFHEASDLWSGFSIQPDRMDDRSAAQAKRYGIVLSETSERTFKGMRLFPDSGNSVCIIIWRVFHKSDPAADPPAAFFQERKPHPAAADMDQ